MNKPPEMHLNDVLSNAVRGDSEAAQCLLAQCRPLMKLAAGQHMRRRFQSRFDESDVVQVAFVEAYHAFNSFRGRNERELLAWLQTILRRTMTRLFDHHSFGKRDIGREADFEPFFQGDCNSGMSIVWNRLYDDGPGPVSQVISGEKAILLASAMHQLPAEYRRVIELRFLDGKKMREIAGETEASIGRVAGLLRRALDELYNLLPDNLRQEIQGEDR